MEPQCMIASGATPPEAQKNPAKVTKKASNVSKTLQGTSVDSQVQHTNDDSVVSKRSAGRMGYASDDYLRHFVRKVARRSPLINRGYYLRILAMTRLVEDTLRHFHTVFSNTASSATPAPAAAASLPPRLQVISLGAGFDTLAARCYDMKDFQHVHWYEVDFPEVIRNKTQLMCAAPMSSFPFHATATVRDGKEVVADRYSAVGLDLRNTSTELISLLKNSSAGGDFSVEAPTVVYAECVMQYMDTDCSDAIVKWVASTFPRAVFYAYDQLHPSDSFGHTMTTSLKSKQSPLLGVHALSGGLALCQRALREGMSFVRFSNFYKMSRFLFDDAELARHDAIESFDEMEEWCEMCEHYGILLGATDTALGASLTSSWRKTTSAEDNDLSPFQDYLVTNDDSGGGVSTSSTSDAEGSTLAMLRPQLGPLSTAQWPTGRCAIEGWGFGGIETLSMRTSAAASSHDAVFVAFGGLLSAKGQARSNVMLAHSLAHGDIPVRMVPGNGTNQKSLPLPALVFHTLHALGNNMFLVIGGRTNPAEASNKVYELQVDVTEYPTSVTCTWSEKSPVGDAAPIGRYRHAAVVLRDKTTVHDDLAHRQRVFLYGGRGADGSTLGDAWSLEYQPASTSSPSSVCWRELRLQQGIEQMPPLHSSAVVAIDSNTVLVSGGASSLHEATNRIWIITIAEQHNAIVKASQTHIGAKRFSHAMVLVTPPTNSVSDATAAVAAPETPFLLVQGGSTTEPKLADDLTDCWACPLSSIIVSDNKGQRHDGPREISVSSLHLGGVRIGTWTRHSLVQVSPNILAVLGGGLTCFSFGTYSCKPQLLMLQEKSLCQAELSPIIAAQSHSVAVGSSFVVTSGEASDVNRTSITSPASQSAVPQTIQIHRTVPEMPYSPLIFCATLHGSASPQLDGSPDAAAAAKKKKNSVLTESYKPKVFRGVPMGPCVEAWQRDPASIISEEESAQLPSIAVHVSKLPQPHFDFVRKNFVFRHVSIREMLVHCFSDEKGTNNKQPTTESDDRDKEFWYFRSVGKNMKTDRSDFWSDFPLLAKDVLLPSGPEHLGWDIVKRNLHQSCLRINQAHMQLWTHYDTMDNVLLQMVGVKRVVLFPPEQHGNLYMKGSSSRVTNMDEPDLARFPRFADALKHAMVVDLHPGDVLFIPANWFHHITAKSSCIGLNLFYQRNGMRRELFDAKDLYGNKDPVSCAALREKLLGDVLKHFGELHRGEQVPADYAQMALRQLIQDLEEAAENLSATIGKL